MDIYVSPTYASRCDILAGFLSVSLSVNICINRTYLHFFFQPNSADVFVISL